MNKNSEELKQVILSALTEIAPDITPEDLDGDMDLRRDLDIDSVDYLNFIIKLHGKLGVDVPEADYAQLATLNKAIAYLGGRSPSPS